MVLTAVAVYKLGIIWLLIKSHIINSFKKLLKWSRTEATHQLWGTGQLFSYNQESFYCHPDKPCSFPEYIMSLVIINMLTTLAP